MRKLWLLGGVAVMVLLAAMVVYGATTVNGHSVPTYSELNSTGKGLAQQRMLDILTDAATAIDTDGRLDAAIVAAGDITVIGKINVDTIANANVTITGILNCDTIAGTLTATGSATVEGNLSVDGLLTCDTIVGAITVPGKLSIVDSLQVGEGTWLNKIVAIGTDTLVFILGSGDSLIIAKTR